MRLTELERSSLAQPRRADASARNQEGEAAAQGRHAAPATSTIDVKLTDDEIEKLRQSGIRLDADGRFWHEGAEVTHPGLRAAFWRWLDRNPDGRWVLRLDEQALRLPRRRRHAVRGPLGALGRRPRPSPRLTDDSEARSTAPRCGCSPPAAPSYRQSPASTPVSPPPPGTPCERHMTTRNGAAWLDAAGGPYTLQVKKLSPLVNGGDFFGGEAGFGEDRGGVLAQRGGGRWPSGRPKGVRSCLWSPSWKNIWRALCCGWCASSSGDSTGSTQASAPAKIGSHSSRVFVPRIAWISSRTRACARGARDQLRRDRRAGRWPG